MLVSCFCRPSTLAEEIICDEDTGGGLVKLEEQGIMTGGFCLAVETNETTEKEKKPKPARWMSCKDLVTGMIRELVFYQEHVSLPEKCRI